MNIGEIISKLDEYILKEGVPDKVEELKSIKSELEATYQTHNWKSYAELIKILNDKANNQPANVLPVLETVLSTSFSVGHKQGSKEALASCLANEEEWKKALNQELEGNDIKDVKLLIQYYKKGKVSEIDKVKRRVMILILLVSIFSSIFLGYKGFQVLDREMANNSDSIDYSDFDITIMNRSASDSSDFHLNKKDSGKDISKGNDHRILKDSNVILSKKSGGFFGGSMLWAGISLIAMAVFLFIVSNTAFATYFARKKGL